MGEPCLLATCSPQVLGYLQWFLLQKTTSRLTHCQHRSTRRTPKHFNKQKRYLLVYGQLVTLAAQKQKLTIRSVVDGQLRPEITEQTKRNKFNTHGDGGALGSQVGQYFGASERDLERRTHHTSKTYKKGSTNQTRGEVLSKYIHPVKGKVLRSAPLHVTSLLDAGHLF